MTGLRMLHLLHGNRAVVRHINHKSGFLQNLNGDLLIQFIVFHQKNLLSFKACIVLRNIFFFIGCCKRRFQNLSQFGQEDRLGTKSSHARLSCLFFNIGPVIGRQNDDGFFFPHNAPNPSHNLDPVHIRHQPVNNISGIFIILLVGKLRPKHRFFTGCGPVRPHADGGQHLGHTGTGIKIIVHHKRPQALKLRNDLLPYRTGTGPELKCHRKCRSLSDLTGDGNRSVHHIHNVLGNRHAKTGTLNAADRTRPLSLKGFKHMLQKLLTHADSGILYLEFIRSMTFESRSFLQNPNSHNTAGFCKFHGVAQKVQKNLIQSEPVTHHMFIHHICRIDIKFQLPGCNIRLHDRLQIMHDLRKGCLFFFDLHLAAFDAAHIQHVVDQTEQMIAGRGDFTQIILHLLLIIHMSSGKRGKTYDGVHRRPDIVGHIVQERGFCPVGMLRRCQRILQIDLLLLQPLFQLFLIINIHKQSHKSDR